MQSFTIKKLEKNQKVIAFPYEKTGFHYPIKAKNSINVKEIIIVKPSLIDKLIYQNFAKRYKKLIELYLNSLQEDEDTASGNMMIALDEVARLRSFIIRKYAKYLSKEMVDKMLKKLKIAENEIRIKIIDFKLIKEQEKINQEEQKKGR